MNPKDQKTIGFMVRKDFPIGGSDLIHNVQEIFDDMWDALPKSARIQIQKKYTEKVKIINEVLEKCRLDKLKMK